jgi:hypothetical protein
MRHGKSKESFAIINPEILSRRNERPASFMCAWGCDAGASQYSMVKIIHFIFFRS